MQSGGPPGPPPGMRPQAQPGTYTGRGPPYASTPVAPGPHGNSPYPTPGQVYGTPPSHALAPGPPGAPPPSVFTPGQFPPQRPPPPGVQSTPVSTMRPTNPPQPSAFPSQPPSSTPPPFARPMTMTPTPPAGPSFGPPGPGGPRLMDPGPMGAPPGSARPVGPPPGGFASPIPSPYTPQYSGTPAPSVPPPTMGAPQAAPSPSFSGFRPPPPGMTAMGADGAQQFSPTYSGGAVQQGHRPGQGPPPVQMVQAHIPPSFGPPPTGVYPGGVVPAQQPYPDSYATGAYGATTAPPLPGYEGVQQMVEDFQSLSMTPHPGSMTEAVDPGALPRPTDGLEVPPVTCSANADPRFVRLTCNVMPNAQSLRSRWQLPLGAVIHPLAPMPPGEEVPVVNFGASGIVRCRRCRTYINPYVAFADGGRRWRCNVCSLLNEVPADYYCPLDQSGRRRDVDERPELCRGSVEFVAPSEYMVRPPMPPVYFFLIDVSAPAVSSGMLQVVAETIKACLDGLPGESRTQIAFLTFDSTLHFFSLKASLSQPQMMVVAELDEPFLPVPDDLLVNLSESREVVDALLDSLPTMFSTNTNVESALGPALKSTYMIMNQLGGKLLIFQSQLPSLGIGRLRLRGDDPRVYGTEREHLLRVTDDPFYKQLAADCSRVQISVNIYAFAAQYTDLASLGTLSRYTGGQVYYYPGFTAALQGEKLRQELTRDLTRETAWEAVMRIRCGKGLRISNFHGHFFVRSTDLLALPAVDCDKGFAIQIAHEDTLLATPTIYFQCALLYTSSSGERRIRVHTVATAVVGDLSDMYRATDNGAIVNLLSKIAIERTMTSKLEEARGLVLQKCVSGLREYRHCFPPHRTTGRLVFPEPLKLLPIYSLALLKSVALRGGAQEVRPDERSAAIFDMMNMPIDRMLRFLYPLLIRIDDMPKECGRPDEDGMVKLPPGLPLAVEKLDPRGIFLLDDGTRAILWLGKVLPHELAVQILGPAGASSVDLRSVLVTAQQNDLSQRLMAILGELRRGNTVYQECAVVRQGDTREQLLLSTLVEDRGPGSLSYVDWIVQVHRQAQAKA